MQNPFQRLDSRVIYENHYFRVREDRVERPNGDRSPFAVLEVRSGASVLAMDDQDRVYLVREFKYAIGRPSLEVISGGIDDGEEPLAAAQRELREEVGLLAEEWKDLGALDPFTTFLVSPNYLFLARKLTHVPRNPDEGEILETEHISLDSAVQRVLSGDITHGATCVLLLKAQIMRKDGR